MSSQSCALSKANTNFVADLTNSFKEHSVGRLKQKIQLEFYSFIRHMGRKIKASENNLKSIFLILAHISTCLD